MEYIQNTEVSPLISKGICKVCYVGQEPNRNGTVITKEVATEMGRKLPGSPVVGYFSKEDNDFQGHERELVLEDGKCELVELTKPYGFVPTNANVWFEKFEDDGVEHEYLVTDVYIWTGAYPESQRIFEQGNNQSMELKNSTGFWTNDNKTHARIFIYNEAIIEKLCILGENYEPCFEGAQIYSLEDDPQFQEFKAQMFSMIEELQDSLDKGGSQIPMEDTKVVEQSVEEIVVDSYNLDEMQEYQELLGKYSELEQNYEALQQANTDLTTEVEALREFKLNAERENKQRMIDSFYMLSDEDKKDVTEHIDEYSLDDIEAKLSVICVRNKVNFEVEEEKHEDNSNSAPQGLFSLNQIVDDGVPEWLKAVKANER